MRFAFYGRVSTDDAQNPTLSIPRQLAACERAIESVSGSIIATYWDVESGRKNLDKRGNGNGDGLGISVPRSGGLGDLLEASKTKGAFDAVIVESIDRLSRMTADATHIERELKQRDVGLFASDEPMVANATALLTTGQARHRRVVRHRPRREEPPRYGAKRAAGLAYGRTSALRLPTGRAPAPQSA